MGKKTIDERYVDTWTDHEARYALTPDAVDRGLAKRGVVLTPIELQAVTSFVESIGDLVAETETAEQLSEEIAEFLVQSGPVFARFLAVWTMEHVLMGGASLSDESDHVLADGVLGSAISEASARLDPMLRKLQPKWFAGMPGRNRLQSVTDDA